MPRCRYHTAHCRRSSDAGRTFKRLFPTRDDAERLARTWQDGPSGLADGLEPAATLVGRYRETVLPARAEAKRGVLEMLATTRMIELLEIRPRRV